MTNLVQKAIDMYWEECNYVVPPDNKYRGPDIVEKYIHWLEVKVYEANYGYSGNEIRETFEKELLRNVNTNN